MTSVILIAAFIPPVHIPESIDVPNIGDISGIIDPYMAALLLLLGLYLINRDKDKKSKSDKPVLTFHLTPISVRQGNVVHTGIIDLQDSSGYSLTRLYGNLNNGNGILSRVRIQNHDFIALVYMRSGTLDWYNHIIDGSRPDNTRTVNTLPFSLNISRVQSLERQYNLVFMTGLFSDVKRVTPINYEISLDITPICFCSPSRFW